MTHRMKIVFPRALVHRSLGLAAALLVCLAPALTAQEGRTAPPPSAEPPAVVVAPVASDRVTVDEADALDATVQKLVIASVAAGKREWVTVLVDGARAQGRVASADEKMLGVAITNGPDMTLAWAGWRKMDPALGLHLGVAYLPADDARSQLKLGRYCLARSLLPEADTRLHRALELDPSLSSDGSYLAAQAELKRMQAEAAPVKEATAAPVAGPEPTARADASTAAVLRRLGKRAVMLGVSSAPYDKWVVATAQQGMPWDMRYQYLSGGANVGRTWKDWDQPAGSFVSNYCHESEKLGMIPVFTWYQMMQSSPGAGTGSEAAQNKRNCETPETMKAYFEGLALFFTKAAEVKKPAILHVEPDMWGYMQIDPIFKPNDPTQVRVMVRSTGIADFAKLGDTAADLGKAIAMLRDKLAPNVLLAWHGSKWGNPTGQASADFCMKCGQWDLVFADTSDRDAGWKVFHKTAGADAYQSEAAFASFRAWCEDIHRITKLPIMLWQLPYGNTIMAACDNTPGHFQDTTAPYFLEGYPSNHHLAEWASAGVIGYLFGGTMGDSTFPDDACKDGITNPAGAKGLKSLNADDDGGYFRSRATTYFKKPLALSGK